MHQTILLLRNMLLVGLSLLLLWLLYRRFRASVLARDLPVVRHAEVLALAVAYHPTRLLLTLRLPMEQEVHNTVKSEVMDVLHTWPEQRMAPGDHHVELALPELASGDYFLEVRTATQHTARRFRLQVA